MKWTRPADLRAQVQKLWDRGELPASLVSGQSLFPRRLALKAPTSAEMIERFDEVRSWVAEVREALHCRVEMREFRHRVLGTNAVPHEVWLDNVEDALMIIGKQRAAARIRELLEVTQRVQPELLIWLAKRPLKALELYGEWERLLEIVAWVRKHPRPDLYLRQVDIPGVHTKLIEAHRGVLSELLDLVLPPQMIDTTVSGVTRFARRYGFREKPVRIRFRVLDPDHDPLLCGQDITLDIDSFARLDPKVSQVFITENEINFLAFPDVKDSLIIFGAGYGFELLRRAEWLSGCVVRYWGDIDTHGFAILNQLRGQFEHVDSFLMDTETFLAFKSQWGHEDSQTLRDLPKLTQKEKNLYDDLRDNRYGKQLRLEQERISFGWVELALKSVMPDDTQLRNRTTLH